MSAERTYRLGDLQLRIMRILWRAGPVSVARVHEELGGSLAYTTVATMLRKMEDRGLVGHRPLAAAGARNPVEPFRSAR